MPIYRATATSLTNLVAADGSSGGFVQDAQTGAGGLALLDDASIAAVHQTIASAGSVYCPARVLFRLIGADMNSTADQQFTKIGTFSTWTHLANGGYKLINPSISLTTCVGGIYTAAAKGGDMLVANTQTYTGASTSGGSQTLTISALGGGLRSETPYLSLTTAQGAAATADLYIFGIALS